MSGQPLSTLHTNGNYLFGTSVLGGIQEQVALAARVIAGWSIVEMELGHAFAGLIGAKTPAAMEMYAEFESFAVQKRMLLSAAEHTLANRYSRLTRVTLSVIDRYASERHRFAHWVLGASADPKFSRELLLAADPKHFWRTTVARFKYWKRKRTERNHLPAVLMQPKIDLENIVAYRNADLLRICAHIETTYFYAVTLRHLFEKPSQRQSLYRLLTDQPDIAQALEKDRRNHAKRKQADRKLPRG